MEASHGLIEWTAEEESEGVRRMTFRVRPEMLPAPIQNELQRILDCARLSLNQVARADSFSGKLDAASFHPNPGRGRLDLEQLRIETEQWILRAAVRDAVETIHFLLDQLRLVFVTWSFLGRTFDAQEYNDRIDEESRSARTAGIAKKLKGLRKDFGLEIPQAWVRDIESLVQLRNCLVHRFGFVSPFDAPGRGVLATRWERDWSSNCPTAPSIRCVAALS